MNFRLIAEKELKIQKDLKFNSSFIIAQRQIYDYKFKGKDFT